MSQKEEDKCHLIPLVCGICNITPMDLSTKQNRPTDVENRRGCQAGGGLGEGWSLRFSDETVEWITKVLRYSTGTIFNIP